MLLTVIAVRHYRLWRHAACRGSILYHLDWNLFQSLPCDLNLFQSLITVLRQSLYLRPQSSILL
nr:MAG TPA: hypothetical protein [Caudoviricetes sp.]